MSPREQRKQAPRKNGDEKHDEKNPRGRSTKARTPDVPPKRAPSTGSGKPKKPVIYTIIQKIPAADLKLPKPRKPQPAPDPPDPGPDPVPDPPPPPPPPTETGTVFTPDNVYSPCELDTAFDAASLDDTYDLDNTKWNDGLATTTGRGVQVYQSPKSIDIKVNGSATAAVLASGSEESFVSGDFANYLNIEARSARTAKIYHDSSGRKRVARTRIKTRIEYGGKTMDNQYLYLVSGLTEESVLLGNKIASQLPLELDFAPSLTQDSSQFIPRSQSPFLPYRASSRIIASGEHSPESYSVQEQYSPAPGNPPSKDYLITATQQLPRGMSDVAGPMHDQASYGLSSSYAVRQDMPYQPQWTDSQPPSRDRTPANTHSTSSQDNILSSRSEPAHESSDGYYYAPKPHFTAVGKTSYHLLRSEAETENPPQSGYPTVSSSSYYEISSNPQPIPWKHHQN